MKGDLGGVDARTEPHQSVIDSNLFNKKDMYSGWIVIPTPRFLFCNTCTLHIYQSGSWSLQIQFGPAAWNWRIKMLIDWIMCQFLARGLIHNQSGSALGLPLCMALGNRGCGPLYSQGGVLLTMYFNLSNCQQKPPTASNHIASGQHLQFFPYVMAISDCHRVSVIFWSHAPIML